MIDKYFYLIWTLLFGLIWLGLYLRRHDIRSEMLMISLLFGFGGIISEKTHIQDWWQPITVMGGKLGIEDFLIGFFIGGISSVVYEEVRNKRVKVKKRLNLRQFNNWLPVLSFAILFLILFYFFHLSSFYSAVLAYLIGIVYMIRSRNDLLLDAFLSGVLMLLIGITVYSILRMIKPDFIEAFWYLPHVWYAKLYLDIPLGEYIWYFLTGAFIGPLYAFWEKGKLVDVKK